MKVIERMLACWYIYIRSGDEMIEKRKIQWREKNKRKKGTECANLHYTEIYNFFSDIIFARTLMFVALTPRNRANKKKKKGKHLIKKFSLKIYIYELNFYRPLSISHPPVLHFTENLESSHTILQPSVRLKLKNCYISTLCIVSCDITFFLPLVRIYRFYIRSLQ